MTAYYNPGEINYQELEHYFFSLPPPMLIMGDFNTDRQSWDPNLPLHHKNSPGTSLFQILLDSPHLSLLSPPGLPTRFHPYTGVSLVLNFLLGVLSFHNSTFSTGPYMGSDHFPVLASLPQTAPRPHPGYLPRMKSKFSEWPRYEAALTTSLDYSTLSLEEAAEPFSQTLEGTGNTAFHLITSHSHPPPK